MMATGRMGTVLTAALRWKGWTQLINRSEAIGDVDNMMLVQVNSAVNDVSPFLSVTSP